MIIAFYSFALTAIIFALLVLLNKKVMYSAFSLLFCLLAVACLYVLLKADFIAVAQVMIYVGGILVLLIFGIMFTTKTNKDVDLSAGLHNVIAATILSAFFFSLLAYGIANTNFEQLKWIKQKKLLPTVQEESTVKPIGVLLMSDYLLAFEVSAIILLIALIGASFIAGKENKS